MPAGGRLWPSGDDDGDSDGDGDGDEGGDGGGCEDDDDDDDDDNDECMINIKPKETKNITLSLHSSFILGSYSIGIREGRGTRDTLYFSHPIVTMGTSYTSTPQHSVITRPASPSDSGAMQHTGTHPG